MIIAGTIIYVVIGLLMARGAATYLTERFRVEDTNFKSIPKKRSKTYDEWFEEEIEHFAWHGDKRTSDMTKEELEIAYYDYLRKYPSSSQITVYDKYFSWQNDPVSQCLVYTMPVLWLFFLIGYYPVIFLSKVALNVIQKSIEGIDYIGKELANPKGNIRRNK